jgi:hypothetical protein
MLKRLVFLVVLAALAVPAVAASKRLDVKGPVALRGHGLLRGELQATDPASQVQMRLRLGGIRLLDLAGDAKVTCNGEDANQRQNDGGRTVFFCKARRARILVQGSHYKFAVLARQYAMKIPEGVSGILAGRFHVVEPPADSNE